MKTIIIVVFTLSMSLSSLAQGLTNFWLLGYRDTTDQYTTTKRARIDFSSGSPIVTPDTRKMRFADTEANISDANGNLLISSNGIWIADATGDTMLNGSDLNPCQFTTDYSLSPGGLPIGAGNIILPYPGDTTKYIVFHQTGNYSLNGNSSELYFSTIDMTLNGGLGGVILKNQIVIQDTLNWGIGACRHGNGRDWWIVILKNRTDIIYKILLTPNGIANISTQHLGVPMVIDNVTEPSFSPDGTKFAYTYTYKPSTDWIFNIRLFNFDRCTGIFSNAVFIDCTDTHPGAGVAFSPNSKYVYGATTYHIFQVNSDTSNVVASMDTIATNDGFYSPVSPYLDTFWFLYRAADGKIYGTSGNAVVDLHCINMPDSDGTQCDVQQHSLHIPCWNFRTFPNHPNYFLGASIGSGCDSLTSISQIDNFNFEFLLYPNPVMDQQVRISYLLPQNQNGIFQISDVLGNTVFSYALPQWSTMQFISLPDLSDGVYICIIRAENYKVSKKLCVISK